MQIIEKPMAHTSNLNNGYTIGITTKKNSEILDVYCREGGNLYMTMLEEGDISVVRTFIATAAYQNMDSIQQKPFRFITRVETTQPSWWTPAHGPFFPSNYYIFEVLQ